jgi:acetoacetyl-CoA synthetase
LTDEHLPELLWRPPDGARGSTRLGRFLSSVERSRNLDLPDYESAWRWSVEDLEGFWSSVWEHFDVRASARPARVLPSRQMPGARWFPGAQLNYAEHALTTDGPDPVIVAHSQARLPIELSANELRDQVNRARLGLQRLGVGLGDRVSAYLPNIPEAVVLLLASASLGAVFSSCAPEFGVQAVIDRFGQIQPSVLVAVDGYRYGARAVDRSSELLAIREGLPTLRETVTVPYLGSGNRLGSLTWDEFVNESGTEGHGSSSLEFEQVPFDHPLYVLYSSGTTGLPKPIIHSHGGILLEHLKALGLQSDIGPGDRFFWFTTTGWMMWNFLLSGLVVGSCIVLFDGDPGYPDLLETWRVAQRSKVSWFGTSAPFLMACRKAGLKPAECLDLTTLKAVGSTGAPLSAAGARWVYEAVAPAVMLSSISGGTDVCTAFVGGSPLTEVRAGEIPCRWLGSAVEAFDADGRPVVGSEGELVVTEPMPSMPIGFWGDFTGERFRAAYFETFPGVWRHGDWITLTDRGSCVISGRSDATLNRAGVRMGTAEFYSVVEEVQGVVDSLVVHLEDPEAGSDKLILLVVAPGVADSDVDGEGAGHGEPEKLIPEQQTLEARIRAALRSKLSPRHVPDEIHVVSAIPRTLSGKKLELPVKRILSGEAPSKVASRDALVNPSALDDVAELATQRMEGPNP